ncbi:Lysophospholipase L1 [Alteromonadaceae bacterium Bs31]|nr:Lysophospholipase L1 [Alteromonadaceae bacterium Bs31]
MNGCTNKVLLVVLLGLFVSASALPACARQFSPDHSKIHYQGRIDFSQGQNPDLVWQGSSVEFTLKGEKLQLGFADVAEQAFFDLDVNGKTRLFKAENGWHNISLEQGVKKHHIKLFKRSEANMGSARFTGIKADDKAKIITTKRNKPKKRFIFYGDSITAGACNEDGEHDQWQDFSTHNNRLSYGMFTAKALNASYRNISVSGMGISTGYVNVTVDQVWNRYNPKADAKPAWPAKYKPHVVFINFGENDDSYTAANKLPFPADFTERYVKLVKDMRKFYPKSHIVILRGGMTGGKKSERLIGPWQKVVAELEKNDNKVHHYVFDNWYYLHPRVSHHRAMADELSAWLLKQTWYKRLY